MNTQQLIFAGLCRRWSQKTPTSFLLCLLVTKPIFIWTVQSTKTTYWSPTNPIEFVQKTYVFMQGNSVVRLWWIWNCWALFLWKGSRRKGIDKFSVLYLQGRIYLWWMTSEESKTIVFQTCQSHSWYYSEQHY